MNARPTPSGIHRTNVAPFYRVFLALILTVSLVATQAPLVARAAPDAPQATTVIAALSDYGSGNTLEQTVATMIAGWNPVRIVTAGDNYHYQDCSTYPTCVGNYYGTYVTNQTFMPTLGNHDYDSAVGLTAYNNYFTWLPTSPDSQRRWYDFVIGDVHFFMLDGNGNQSTQSAWLATAVPASTSVWNIAIIHQAPYSTGYYGDISASQLPFGQYGIDFVISGHNHHFERLAKADSGKTVRYFIDGYGGSILSGSSGHSYCGYNTTAATSEYCLADTPGALKITASNASISFQYYDSGGVLRNTYTQDAEVTGPVISTSVASLPAFGTATGTASPSQAYTVSGSSLTANISIAAPAGFELSTNGTTYGSSLTLAQSSGTVAATTIYARLTGAAAGNYSGNIAHTSAGATEKDVAVSGAVGTATCSTVNLVAAEDTYLSAGNVTYNNGGNTALHVNGMTDTNRRTTLLKWNVSSIPAGATVQSASLSLNVTDASPLVFNLYNLRRAWVEGTSNSAASSNSANWNTTDGSTAWGTVGAASTTADRYDTNLWSAGATSFSSTGAKTEALNTAGVAVVQGWVSGTGANYGLIIQNYSGTTNNAMYVDSSEATTTANQPKLNVTYCVVTGPTITTSASALTAFRTTPGNPSAAQTYTVSGSNLTENIVITPPAGFELSKDGSAYSSSLTLTQSGGTVATTTIYARLTGAAVGDFIGSITHISSGATQKDVAVSGAVSTQVCYDDQAFVASADTYMSGYNTTYNYGAQTYMRVTLGTSSQRGSLVRWDLSSIPANAVVSAASLKLYVSTAGSATYNLYNLRRAWVEGTGSGSATGDGATWQLYDGVSGHTWGTSGAASTTTDRYDTNLWGAGSSSFSGTGSKTIALNSDGLAVAQGWVSGSMPNYGLTIQNYTSGSTDVQFSTKENSTTANRPQLLLDYCYSSGTTYTLTAGNDGHGTVTLSPAGGVYVADAVVTLTPAPASGYQFSSWSGTDAGDIVNTAGVYTIVMDENKSVTANFSLIPVNDPPDAPVLIQPADNATGQSTTSTLAVTVTDPEADPMSVSFYGRAASAATPAEDFTLVVIPDTQNEVTSYPTVLTNQFQWIANQYTAGSAASIAKNIKFATNVGDIVNTSSSTTEYSRADGAFDLLDTGGVPYSVGPGNHDIAMGTTSYSTYFGKARFTGKSWYGGDYTGGSDNYNSYSLFSAGGMDFILINLQYSPGSGALDWADALLKANPTRRGIVEQHDILNIDNSWNNQASYTALSDNANLFLMVCGHMHGSSDGSAYRLESRSGMNPVHVLLTDYQDASNGGNGYLRLLRFAPTEDKIYAQVYSPTVPGYLTSATNYEQFEMAYDMEGTAAAPWTLIGTVNGVASGANASITWPGRADNTEYEWYAAASDGSLSTDSAVWSFTTGATTVNQPPVVMDIPNQTIAEGATFTTISLDGYVSDADNTDAELTWTYSGNTALTVSIANHVATIGIPNAEWNGAETITFKATDPGGLFDDDAATFTVTAVNDAPVVTGIPDQTIAEGATFATINLDDYVTDPDNADAQMTWTYSGYSALSVSIDANRVATISMNAEWNGTDAIMFTATDPGGLHDDDAAVFTVTAVNDAPVVSDIPDQTVAEGASFTTINLDNYVTDVDDNIAQMTWTYSGNTALTVSIVNRVATITAPNADWTGAETITFKATDPGGLYDDDAAVFTVTAVNDAPVITGQTLLSTPRNTPLTIVLGNLVVTDPDDAYPADFTLTVLAGANYTVNGATITPATGYVGTLTVPVKVNDGAADSNTFDLTVTVVEGGTPILPSSFWGGIHYISGGPAAGDVIYAYVDSQANPMNSATIVLDGGAPAYAINVPAYSDGTLPTTVTLKINGRAVAKAPWATGTNVRLDIHPPEANAGGPYVVPAVQGSVTLAGAAQDWGADASAFAWDLDDDGAYDDSTVANPAFAFSAPGTYPLALKVTDAQSAEGYATSDVIAVRLDGLTGQVFDGQPHAVSVVGVASPYTYDALYDGSATPPTAVGSYPVVVEVKLNGMVVGTISGTLEITGQKCVVSLVAGWNLVSCHLKPVDTDVADVLSSLDGNYDLVYAWDAAGGHSGAGNWLKYDPSVPYGSSLTSLDDTQGFWIHMTAADTLEVYGSYATTTAIGLKKAAGGWNLIGYPSATSTALPAALAGIAGKYTLVYAYRANDPADLWKLYDPAAPTYVNDLTQMGPGWGYWIYVSEDATLNVAH